MKKRIDSSETLLIGNWVSRGNVLVADETCKRIEYLTKHILKEVATSDDGWDTLYVDAGDFRYWELTYPNSESHGGGAPSLKCLSRQEVAGKYNI